MVARPRNVARMTRFARLLGVLVTATAALAAVSAPAQAAPLTWSPAVGIDNKGPFTEKSIITAVECASVTFCMAVNTFGEVVTSRTPAAPPPAWSVPAFASFSVFTALWCQSESLCIGAGAGGDVTFTRNPTAPSPTWSPLVDTVPTGPPPVLTAMGCASEALCVIFTDDGKAIVSTNPTAAAPVWTASPAPVALGVTAVECPSTALCVAATNTGTVVATTDPTAAVPTWSAPVTVVAGGFFNGLACPSVSLCVAAGAGVYVSKNPGATPPTWTEQADLPGIYKSVSCPTATGCVTLGNTVAAATTDITATTPSWTFAPTASNLDKLACAGQSLCVAARADNKGVAVSADPFAPQPTWSPLVEIHGTNKLTGASCPTETLCVAVDDAGHVMTSRNPTAVAPVWTLADAPGVFTDVSCASASLCVAVNTAGFAVYSRNPGDPAPTWTAQQIDFVPGRQLTGVSCPTTSLCVAVDKGGDTIVSTDPGGLPTPTWGAATTIEAGTQPFAISCTASGLCAVAERSGHMFATSNVIAAAPAWTKTPVAPGIGFNDVVLPGTRALRRRRLQWRHEIDGAGRHRARLVRPGPDRPRRHRRVMRDHRPVCRCGREPPPAVGGRRADLGRADRRHARRARVLHGRVCIRLALRRGRLDRTRHARCRTAREHGAADDLRHAGARADADGHRRSVDRDPTTVTRAWQRCEAAACADIAGETGLTYVVQAADQGATLRVQETAVNGGGTGTATASVLVPSPPGPSPSPEPSPSPGPSSPGPSSPTPTPATGPTDAQIRAALRPALRVTGAAARHKALLKRGFSFTFKAPAAGRVAVTWESIPPKGARGRKAKPVVLARGGAQVKSGQTTKVAVKLTAAGKKALRKAKRLKVRVRATFTLPGRRAVAVTGLATLRR